VYYVDAAGKEHQTAADAANANVEDGNPGGAVEWRFMLFDVMFYKKDVRKAPYVDRLKLVVAMSEFLHACNPNFVVIYVAKTATEKSELARMQESEGREGEVWSRKDRAYIAGKNKSDDFVRTKYVLELNLHVQALTPTTAEDRLFGAVEVTDDYHFSMGSVGSGFSHEIQQKIVDEFNRLGWDYVIPVVSQGLTTNHQLVHGRINKEEFEL
jgi:ATP-dependent DNA ligase